VATEVVVALVAALGGILVALIQSTRRQASLAAERSAPTGNGYAGRTEAALARLEAIAESTQRDIGGLRAEVRATRRQLDHTARRLDRHLERED